MSSDAQRANHVIRLSHSRPLLSAIAAFAEGCFWCSNIFEALVELDLPYRDSAGNRYNLVMNW